MIATGDVNLVQNNAVITVEGPATIDGTLQTTDGRLTLMVEGDLMVNGSLQATGRAPNDSDVNRELDEQPSGIFIIVTTGTVTFSPTSTVISTGPVVVTDDDSILDETPGALYGEVENVAGEDIPTLAPLSPDNPAFTTQENKLPAKRPPLLQAVSAGPITISGAWPPAGARPVPGDRSILIFRFGGERPLILDDWTVNGPAAPNGTGQDESGDPGETATGGRGRYGMRLNIRNDGGPINIVDAVVLNLADGGNGGSAAATCADATGGAGGVSGNFRMSATDGIDISDGTLTINPGRGGDGGNATVEPGEPGADGCPGGDGEGATATGGTGADNQKRLFVRGAVTGLANVTIGAVEAGNGGDAIVEACDAGAGDPCCNGGDGGDAEAIGGAGGNALLNATGTPIAAGAVRGGNGGTAEANAGFAGDGGDCKFDDAGDGGDGGNAVATGGRGGSATNSSGGVAEGGDGGNAEAAGGDGGAGGDSGFGIIGLGGFGGTATAMGGNGGAGNVPGSDGDEEDDDGNEGLDGEQMQAAIFCLTLTDFIDLIGATILPGQYEGPVTGADNRTQIGEIDIIFAVVPGAEYVSSATPVPHVGIAGGALVVDVASLALDTPPPGSVGGIRIAPLAAEGISVNNPLVIRAIGTINQVLDTVAVTALPDNTGNPASPQSIDVFFETDAEIAEIEIIVPAAGFVTLIRVYLLDP